MERSAVACGWAKMHRFGWMILLGLVGCASQAPQIHPEVARLERFVGDFRAAVEAGDAAALYDMMAADVRDAVSGTTTGPSGSASGKGRNDGHRSDQSVL